MTEPTLGDLRALLVEATRGPWELCQHLKGVEEDRGCRCGYRGVVYGPEHEGFAVFQPGHDPASEGQEGLEPQRYPREIEIANSQLIVAAVNALPGLLDQIDTLMKERDEARSQLEAERIWFDINTKALKGEMILRDAAESRCAKLEEAFRTADHIACGAFETGYYVGEGLLEKLAAARQALGDKDVG